MLPKNTLQSYNLADNSLLNGQPYTVILRQQPIQARVSLPSEKATERKPIEPCPIVELRFVDPNAHGKHSSLHSHPFYFAYVSLFDDKTGKEVILTNDYSSKSLCGSVASSLYRLKDIDGVHGAFFIFPDIAVRIEGSFKLQIIIFEIIGNDVFKRHILYTQSFLALHPRDYKGVLDGTTLSRCFVDQGLKIRYKKDSNRSEKASKKRSGDFSSVDTNKDSENTSSNPPSYHPPLVSSVQYGSLHSHRLRRQLKEHPDHQSIDMSSMGSTSSVERHDPSQLTAANQPNQQSVYDMPPNNNDQAFVNEEPNAYPLPSKLVSTAPESHRDFIASHKIQYNSNQNPPSTMHHLHPRRMNANMGDNHASQNYKVSYHPYQRPMTHYRQGPIHGSYRTASPGQRVENPYPSGYQVPVRYSSPVSLHHNRMTHDQYDNPTTTTSGIPNPYTGAYPESHPYPYHSKIMVEHRPVQHAREGLPYDNSSPTQVIDPRSFTSGRLQHHLKTIDNNSTFDPSFRESVRVSSGHFSAIHPDASHSNLTQHYPESYPPPLGQPRNTMLPANPSNIPPSHYPSYPPAHHDQKMPVISSYPPSHTASQYSYPPRNPMHYRAEDRFMYPSASVYRSGSYEPSPLSKPETHHQREPIPSPSVYKQHPTPLPPISTMTRVPPYVEAPIPENLSAPYNSSSRPNS